MLKSSNVYAFGVFLLIVSVNGDFGGIKTQSPKSNLQPFSTVEQGTAEGRSDGNYKSSTSPDITCPMINTENSSLIVRYPNGNKVNSRATFRCNGDAKLIGENSTICMPIGQWSNPIPTCESNVTKNSTCGPPPHIEGATVSDLDEEEHAIGTEIKYQCNLGYVSQVPGGIKSVCQFNKTTRKAEWTKPEVSCSHNVTDNSTCGPPLDIEEATAPDLDEEEHAIGTEINYQCKIGYVSRIPGGFKSVCEFDETTRKAEWTKPEVSCAPRSCGDPGYVTNGRRIGNLFTFPNKIDFECDEGYKLKGLKSRYCQARGEWSGRRLPTCELIHCSEPTNPVNGRVSYSSLGYGSELQYECNRGFVLKNHVSRVCTADGEWSDEEPDCIEVTCEKPLPPEKGSVQFSDGQSVGSIATYSCEEGTALVGVSSSKCLENGVWTSDPPKCLRSCIIPVIENGVIGFYKTVQKHRQTYQEFVQLQVGGTVKPGESVVLRCQHGFIPMNLTTSLNGDAENIWCRAGVWSKSMQCAPSKCLGEPPPIENGYPVVPSNTNGTVIWYTCAIGLDKLEGGHVECVYGTWKGHTPVCGDSRCFKNSLNYPGLILPTTEYLTNSTSFTINCEAGYEKISSKEKIRCLKGKWEVESNPCAIRDQSYKARCNLFLKSETLEVFYDNDGEVGSIATFSCVSPYNLVGSHQATCLENGTWNSALPSCEGNCEEEPPPIQNGRIESFDRVHGSEVRYRCDGNFEISRGSSVICNSGKWEGDPPQCQEIGRIHLLEIRPVQQNNLDREKHSSTSEVPSSSSPSVTTDNCYCTYDYPPDLVAAYSGNRPVVAKSVIWKGDAVSLRCLYGDMHIFWTNGLSFYGSPVNLTCDTCRNWSRYDLPNCRVREPGDSFLIFSNDMKILPEGTIEIPRHMNVSFECINLDQAPAWNTNGDISGTYVSPPWYDGRFHRTSLQIIHARDSHARQYACYTTIDGRVYRATTLFLKIAAFEIQCPLLEENTNRGIFNIQYENKRKVHSVAKYACYSRTQKLVGASSRECMPNGQWSGSHPSCEDFEIQCPRLAENTNHGIFNIQYENNRKVHSVAKYACYSRTQKLLGTSSRECMPDGQWSGSHPSCEDISCPWIDTYNSLVVTYTDGNKVNSRATFRCGRNVKLMGRNSAICRHNGQWSNPKPTCENNYASCDPFVKSENLDVVYDNDVKVGSKAKFSCVPPYKLVGSRWATCLQTRIWSRALPSCEMPKCSIQSLSQNLPEDVYPDLRNVTEDYVPYGTELQLVCNPGSFLSGGSIAKCGEQEIWEHGKVTCNKVCILGETTSKLLVDPVKDLYSFGESITLSCPPGQKLSSETQRVMCLGSLWSDPIPECVDAP